MLQFRLDGQDGIYGHYRYSALVTDLKLPALVIWRTYRGRADCENRIKELKYDFAADSFPPRHEELHLDDRTVGAVQQLRFTGALFTSVFYGGWG